MMARIDAEQVRDRVQALPMLPAAAHELMAAFRDDDIGFDDLARKIDIDPAITARILRVANSSFYGMSGSIATVGDAIRLIGLRTVETIVMQESLAQRFHGPGCPTFDFPRYWEHSLATAVAAQELARESGHAMHEAFTAGLIHDLGSLALASHFPQEYGAVVRDARDRDLPRLEAERAALGIDHCQVGAWIAAHWHFTEAVIDAIAWHHNPGHLSGEDEDSDAVAGTSSRRPGRASLADLVHNADGIAHALDLHAAGDDLVPPMQRASWDRLQWSAEAPLRLFHRVETAFREIRHGLR